MLGDVALVRSALEGCPLPPSLKPAGETPRRFPRWGESQAIAATRLEELPPSVVAEAAKLVGKEEKLAASFEDASVQAALRRQGLTVAQVLGISAAGGQLAQRIVAQILWEAAVLRAGGASEAAAATPSSARAGRSHGEARRRPQSAQEYRFYRCAQIRDSDQAQLDLRQDLIQEAREIRGQQLRERSIAKHLAHAEKVAKTNEFKTQQRLDLQARQMETYMRDVQRSEEQASTLQADRKKVQEVMAAKAKRREEHAKAGKMWLDMKRQDFEQQTSTKVAWTNALAETRRQRALSTTSATPRQMRATGELVRWQAARMEKIRHDCHVSNLERRGCCA